MKRFTSIATVVAVVVGCMLALTLATGCTRGGDGATPSVTITTSKPPTSSTSGSSTAATLGENDPRVEAGAAWSPAETIPTAEAAMINDVLVSRGLAMLFPSQSPVPGPGLVSAEFSLQRTPSTGLINLLVSVDGQGSGDWLLLVSSRGSLEDFAWVPETTEGFREVVVRGLPGRAYRPTDVSAETVAWQEGAQSFVVAWRWLSADLTAEQVIAWLDSWYRLPREVTLYLAHADDGAWGYIDAGGAWAVEPRFEFAYPFSEGFAGVMVDGFYGYIDTTGALVVPPGLLDARPFSEGVAAVFSEGGEGNRYGYIDTTGTCVLPPRWYDVGPFTDGLAVVRTDEGLGYIDHSGELVIEPRFGEALSFSEGVAAVWVSADSPAPRSTEQTGDVSGVPPRPIGTWGYVDTTGTFVIEPRYQDATSFSEGLAAVRENAAWGYIDLTETFVTDPRFNQALPFSEGLAAVQVDRGWGFIDRTGEWVIEPRFEEATSFSQSLAAVELDRVWGYIDHTGEFVIEPRFDNAGPFSGTLARVYLDSAHQIWGYIDNAGTVVWQRH